MSLGHHVLRGRTIFFGVITTAFAVLMTVVTVRFVSRDDPVGSTIVVLLTAGLWWRAWNSYRALRRRRTATPASEEPEDR